MGVKNENNEPKADAKELVALIREVYGNAGDALSEEQIARAVEDFNSAEKRANMSPQVLGALTVYDKDGNKNLDFSEIAQLKEDIKSTDTGARFFGYTALLVRASRYLAFTSDFGEAFRPVANPWIVRGTYGVSWAYCIADVYYEAYKAKQKGLQGSELNRLVAERSVFQVLASMAIPAFLIHSTVNVASRNIDKFKRLGKYQRWAPSACGLSVIPFLPLFLDHPVESVVSKGFDYIWPQEAHHKKHE